MATSKETSNGFDNVEKMPRLNGWSCPWHPFMIIIWFLSALTIFSYFGFLVFYVPRGICRTIATVVRIMNCIAVYSPGLFSRVAPYNLMNGRAEVQMFYNK